MALLCFNSFLSLSSSSTFVLPVSRLHTGLKPVIDQKQTKSLNGVSLQAPSIWACGRAATMIVNAAAPDMEGKGLDNNKEEEKVLPVDQLPLESKEQQKMEQRIRMKLAKKIRLRRNRLLRKRRMRKKGRWPPSKMKKLKNV